MPEDTIQEVLMLRQNLRAIRDRVNQDLDAIDDQLIRMLPKDALRPARIVTDWKEEVAKW
jgi:hypothetical protein